MTSPDQPDDVHPYVEASPFFRIFSTPTRAKLVDVFLRNYYRNLTTGDLTKLASVDQSSVSRNIEVLIESGLVEYTGRDADGKHYRLNTESDFAKALGRAHSKALSEDIPMDTTSSTKDEEDIIRTEPRHDEGSAKAVEPVKQTVPDLR